LARCRAEALLRAADGRHRQTWKMEALSRMAGAITYDLNDLVTLIYDKLKLIGNHTAAHPEVAELVRDAHIATMKEANLVRKLHAFSRQYPLSPRTISVGEVVPKMFGLLRWILGELVQIELTFPNDLWKVQVDPDALERTLLNLALNAGDAILHRGVLMIEGSNTIVDAGDIVAGYDVPIGNYVLVTVTDTGSGMSEQVLERAFEPFFTTKTAGEGTGLGLSQVFGFVRQSGGHISIQSKHGQGTTVGMHLPAVLGDGRIIELSTNADPHGLPGEIVLVLDDDPLTRELAVGILTNLGYQTIEAVQGPAAREILQGDRRIDLVLTDVIISDGIKRDESYGGGRNLKMLYMSGYSEIDLATALIMTPICICS